MSAATAERARSEEAQGEAQVLSLRDARATERARVGAKAAGLSVALAAGHEVPEGVVVTAGALGPSFDRALERALDELGEGPFAVRSSATHEDGATRSFAGQLETLLSVPRASVRASVERCRRSAGSLRALCYGDPGAAAVIVQRMVRAKAAGVAFSVDPRSGERAALIDATAGLADQLVSGAANPESWRCDEARARCVRSLDASVLDEPTALRVAALARAMEALFGRPQDIEWALDERAVARAVAADHGAARGADRDRVPRARGRLGARRPPRRALAARVGLVSAVRAGDGGAAARRGDPRRSGAHDPLRRALVLADGGAGRFGVAAGVGAVGAGEDRSVAASSESRVRCDARRRELPR